LNWRPRQGCHQTSREGFIQGGSGIDVLEADHGIAGHDPESAVPGKFIRPGALDIDAGDRRARGLVKQIDFVVRGNRRRQHIPIKLNRQSTQAGLRSNIDALGNDSPLAPFKF